MPQRAKTTNDRFLARVAVYLILEHNNKILLSLRQGTGYADGMYSLVSGHVDADESVTHAMIREAQEEIGITIKPGDLHFAHVMYQTHKPTAVTAASFYFKCSVWQGNPLNCEQRLCGQVAFFDKLQLPENLIAPVKQALTEINRSSYFSEYGWQK